MILGIESSCDDSSIALLKADSLELIAHHKISQELEHSLYGGVVPELAARLHTQALPALLERIKPYFTQIKAIAVTNEPGLSVSLIGGVSMAKALHIATGAPLIAVNHLAGHIYSLFLNREISLPLGVLLVSGGHTLVLDINELGEVKILAKTSDDSFGESFDKVAKMMGLGYPGGAIISALAQQCAKKNRFKFTIPLLYDPRLEYSFSGLKNQVRVQIENLGELSDDDRIDVAYAFEQAACAHITDKLAKIFATHRWSKFGVVGGASANPILRTNIEQMCQKFNSELMLAPLEFCSDNAAMIARAGRERFLQGKTLNHKELDISPKSRMLSL